MSEFMATQSFAGALSRLDVLIVALAIAVLMLIAYFSGRKEEDTQDFFLGKRNVPAIVACLSFVATEVSAVTIAAVPAESFRSNWQYLQLFIGSAAARVFIAFLFIPVFYKYNCTTIYEFLRHRFGAETQYSGSVFFFITRLLGSGVRLCVACLAISVIMEWSLVQSLILFTVASVAFIAFGGIKAVVWTGVFETTVFFLAGGALATYLILNIDGGVAEAWRLAGEAGKLSTINLKLTLADPTTLWAGALNGFFVGLCAFGTDQELMQRLLTVKTRRSSQKALVGTILAALPMVCLYLSLGTLLFVFYQQHAGLPLPGNKEEILSHFAKHTLPFGLKGLFLTAIILASIDSPLNSLSSSFVTDIYRPLINKKASERHYLWVSRIGVAGFGIILAGIAFLCRDSKALLWLAFQIIAVTGGSTLGVFLLGVMTKRAANIGNIFAMIFSAIVTANLLYLSEKKVVALGWTWLIVVGTVLTFAVGYLLGPITAKTAAPATFDNHNKGEDENG